MGNALDANAIEQGKHGLHVDAGRRQKRLAKRCAAELRHRGVKIGMLDVENLADQGEAVGMDAAGRKGKHDVAGTHILLAKNAGLVHNAGRIAGKVILVFGIEAGHFSGLAADQRRAGLHAAVANAFDDLLDPLRDVLAAGNVVQEKQRLCTDANNVVDAHRNAVDADGIVLIHQKGELQLGADAVRTGDQNRLRDPGQIQSKKTAEAAHVGADAGGNGRGNVALHQLHGLVTGGDIHTGGSIGVRFGKSVHGLFLSVPAVGAELALRQTDGFNHAIERLELQRGKMEFFADGGAKLFAAFRGAV